MNAVARWARVRDLMSFAGDECIPPSTSLVEARLAVRLHPGRRPCEHPRAM